MKRFKLIFLSLLILCGCQSINVFNLGKSLKKTETIENVFYENFSAKGIVKFHAKIKKISSRFNFIKNGSQEKIDFLDVFNNIIVTFKVEEEKIVIVDGAKKLNSDSLEKIINRPFFKTVILNFSNILMGKVKGNIVDLIGSPLSAAEVTLAIILASVTRSFIICIISIIYLLFS